MTWPETVVVSVTNRRWIADDITEGARGRSTIIWDMGLDALDTSNLGRWALWTPAEHAARLLRAGVPANLSAPGGQLLSDLDRRWTGRKIWHGPWSAIDDAPEEGFFKRAESKLPPEAAWRTRDQLKAAGALIGPNDLFHCSDRNIDFRHEWRCHVTDRVALTASAYRHNNDWWDGSWEHDTGGEETALAFAQQVIDSHHQWPDGFVIDIGADSSGELYVVELNPAWCSGMYNNDRDAVYETIVASSDSSVDHGCFTWTIDSSLARYAASRPLLRPWTSPQAPHGTP